MLYATDPMKIKYTGVLISP